LRLLVVSYQFSHRDSTASLRPRAMAKYLPRYGVDVTILTCGETAAEIECDESVIRVKDITRGSVGRPRYYAWRIWQKGLRMLGHHRGEVEYWRNNAITRSEEIIRHARPDAILVSYPPAEALEIGLMLSRRHGIPLVADFRDGLLFDPVEEDRLRHRATAARYAALEASVASMAKLLVTVSEPLSEHLRRQYAATNVLTLHNGFDPDDQPEGSVDFAPDTFNIVHTGRLGMSRAGTSGAGRGIDALVHAIEPLLGEVPEVRRRMRWHFVGALTQAEVRTLRRLVEAGVATLWGHMPRERALAFQRHADVLLLVTAPDQASVATGKLFEYLRAGRPILALTRGTEAERIIRSTGTGRIVSPDDPGTIRRAIADLSHATWPERNDLRIASFARPTQMAILAERLRSL
jgi:hypothetical protein